MEPNFEKTVQERAVLVGLNADCFTKAQTATDETLEELEALIASMTEQKLTATRLIDSMSDPVGRAILRRRYILCDTWAKIAGACGRMSERNAHYIHDQALLDFEKIYCGQ